MMLRLTGDTAPAPRRKKKTEPRTAAADPFDSDRARWRAVEKREPAADGLFYYAVRTTGVYCRPTCGSRRPRRENAIFYRTWAEAEAAGFRACRKCRPRQEASSSRTPSSWPTLAGGSRRSTPHQPGRSGRRGGAQPLAFPPRLQASDRRHAEGLCPRAARRADSSASSAGGPARPGPSSRPALVRRAAFTRNRAVCWG